MVDGNANIGMSFGGQVTVSRLSPGGGSGGGGSGGGSDNYLNDLAHSPRFSGRSRGELESLSEDEDGGVTLPLRSILSTSTASDDAVDAPRSPSEELNEHTVGGRGRVRQILLAT